MYIRLMVISTGGQCVAMADSYSAEVAARSNSKLSLPHFRHFKQKIALCNSWCFTSVQACLCQSAPPQSLLQTAVTSQL